MRVYLVRHGQCNSNVNKIYNYLDEDINETGVGQAEDLRKLIETIDYDVIYSSSLLRAKHTAEIINAKDKEIIVDDRLRERMHGSLQGKSIDLTDREDFWNYYSNTDYGGEERIPDLFKRVANFLDELKTKEYNTVLVVAHNGTAKAFYAYFNGIPEDGRFLDLGINNTEIKEYEL